jgi:hypothetical protein
MGLCTTSSDLEPARFWMHPRSSASLPWCAVSRRRAVLAGRYAWWPRRPSDVDSFLGWVVRQFECCWKATT